MKMAAALILLFTVCLLPGALCEEFEVTMPQTIEILSGSCVTIPCSFDIEEKYDSELDHTCGAKWLIDKEAVFDSKTTATEDGKLLGDLTNKTCTTTLNKTHSDNESRYMFRVECQNSLMYTFTQQTLAIEAKADPPSPTLSPSTLVVRAGASVTLKCSAPAPCLSLPPHITWTSGDGQETMEDLEDKTQVKTSVLNFTISRLHHKKKMSCTATYSKQNGDAVSAVSQSLRALVSFPPQILDSSNCTKTASEVTCSCEAEGNPFPTVYWYLDGTRLNHSDTFAMSTKPLGDTVLKSIITVSQAHMKHRSTLVCNSSNSLASVSHRLYNNSHEQQAPGQATRTVIATLVGLLLLTCALLVISGIRTQASCCSSPKRQSTGDTSSAAMSYFHPSTGANEIRQADIPHHTSGGAGKRLEKNEDGTDVIYSTVMVKSKCNKQRQHRQQRGDSTDLHLAGSSYAPGTETYAEIKRGKVENQVECQYSQVTFKDRCRTDHDPSFLITVTSAVSGK